MRKNIILMILASSLFLTSCNESPKTHVIFIDITLSTTISKATQNIKALLNSLTKRIDDKVLSGETVIIYPIHAQTLSATAIGRWKMPVAKDMNWKKERSRMLSEISSIVNKKLFIEPIISSKTRLHTSILPIFYKLNNISLDKNIEVTIISDMIQDNSIMSFPKQFISIDNNSVKTLAKQTYVEMKGEIALNNQTISILIPGTEAGNRYGDSFNRKVNSFWTTFFREAGARVFITDLS
jgi:hypothetical protein